MRPATHFVRIAGDTGEGAGDIAPRRAREDCAGEAKTLEPLLVQLLQVSRQGEAAVATSRGTPEHDVLRMS